MISIFDMFRWDWSLIFHTVGPMKAGKQFVDVWSKRGLLNEVTRGGRRLRLTVYRQKSHHTDIAIIMGLAGNQPDTVDIDAIPAFIRDVETRGASAAGTGQHEVDFPRMTACVS